MLDDKSLGISSGSKLFAYGSMVELGQLRNLLNLELALYSERWHGSEYPVKTVYSRH